MDYRELGSMDWIERKIVMKEVRIAAETKTKAAAGAIAGLLREGHTLEVCAIGTKAINQMVKGLALAREFMADDGSELYAFPEFRKVEFVNGEDKTGVAIKFVVTKGEPLNETWKDTYEKTEAVDEEVAP